MMSVVHAGRIVTGPPAGPVARSFGERLARSVAERRSQLVLGLDPDPARLWPRALELAGGAGTPPSPPALRAALAVSIHCSLVIDAVAEQCVAIKLQLACFERLGAPGWAALAEVAERARERGLLVIADAKRGDVDVSAAAYAQAFFGGTQTPYGPVAGLGADALTVNPLLGGDSLAAVRRRGARTGGRVCSCSCGLRIPAPPTCRSWRWPAGDSVSDRLAALVAALGAPGTGPSGLADVGAVVGATAPERLEALRAAMPAAVFLLPGVGAQGGRVEDLAPAFAPGPAGGLISSSRSIVGAHRDTGAKPAAAALAEAARLRELAWNLSS